MEQWKDVRGFESLYQVSNKGNLRSLDRIDYAGRKRKGKKMNVTFSGDGYGRVRLNKEGRRTSFLIHRLVADVFLEPNQDRKEVNHKDAVKSNNHVSNLEWCNRKENIRHAFENNLVRRGCGEELYNSKLTTEIVIEARKMHFQGVALTKLASIYQVSHKTIRYAVLGMSWRHV